MKITEGQVAQFTQHGYVAIPEFFDRREVAAMQTEVERFKREELRRIAFRAWRCSPESAPMMAPKSSASRSQPRGRSRSAELSIHAHEPRIGPGYFSSSLILLFACSIMSDWAESSKETCARYSLNAASASFERPD